MYHMTPPQFEEQLLEHGAHATTALRALARRSAAAGNDDTQPLPPPNSCNCADCACIRSAPTTAASAPAAPATSRGPQKNPRVVSGARNLMVGSRSRMEPDGAGWRSMAPRVYSCTRLRSSPRGLAYSSARPAVMCSIVSLPATPAAARRGSSFTRAPRARAQTATFAPASLRQQAGAVLLSSVFLFGGANQALATGDVVLGAQVFNQSCGACACVRALAALAVGTRYCTARRHAC